MKNAPLVLIVEDDEPIRRFLRTSLKNNGYRLLETESGKQALTLVSSHMPDLIILDLGLPDIDGVELIENLRTWSSIPVIIVSARGKERSKVEALDAGADDYITKPFSMAELLARMRVALRRVSAAVSAEGREVQKIHLGNLTLDMEKRRLFSGNEEIHLTPMEYKLITLLVLNAGKVLTHKYLLTEVWGPASAGETQYLRVFMANVRRKIEPEPARPRYLFTEIGVGYRFADE